MAQSKNDIFDTSNTSIAYLIIALIACIMIPLSCYCIGVDYEKSHQLTPKQEENLIIQGILEKQSQERERMKEWLRK